jgi:sugar O-acyltransferase (sialic acid O-acetyltransferase NeuD family)
MDSVNIPLINPNEPEALLSALHVSEGQGVEVGALLCTLETTKAAAELTAERAGFVTGLRYKTGQTVRAGDVLCYLADTIGEVPPQPILPESKASDEVELPAGLRITQPALALARANRLDLSHFPPGRMVTEADVRAHLDVEAAPDSTPPVTPFDPSAIVVYGGGGHGKSLIDLLRALGTYRIAGVLDDGLSKGDLVLGVPILGGAEALPEVYARGVHLAVNAVGGIGDVSVRIKVFQILAQAGFACPAVAHPSAVIESSASVAPGAQIFPLAYVGSDARLGYGVIVNTGAIVSHDCILGDYTNISPGAVLAGGVQVGNSALVGMGATINLNVKIGAGARIGNGATVKSDVPEKGIVRAGSIWPG